MTELEKTFTPFIEFVLSHANLDYVNYKIRGLESFDGRRIYIALDGGEYSYIIRTWNIAANGINFSLYDETGDDAEEILHGYYSPVPNCSYLYF